MQFSYFYVLYKLSTNIINKVKLENAISQGVVYTCEYDMTIQLTSTIESSELCKNAFSIDNHGQLEIGYEPTLNTECAMLCVNWTLLFFLVINMINNFGWKNSRLMTIGTGMTLQCNYSDNWCRSSGNIVCRVICETPSNLSHTLW